MESSTGREMLDVGRSKWRLSPPFTFLLSLRNIPIEFPADRFCGTGMLMALISSSRMLSCPLFLLDLRRSSAESRVPEWRRDWGR